MKLLNLSIATIVASGMLFASSYTVDSHHTSVGFKVKHMMISNVKGSFDKFSGNFEYDEKTQKIKSLVGTIEASSINTANVKRDKHLRSADFFDVNVYPDIKFVLDRVDDDDAYGKLTIRGITKPVKLEFENTANIKDPWGNTRMGISLSGKIDRKDFGLVYNSVLETGGVLIGDTVKFEVEIEGILQK